jgi:hypothetical protein
MLKDKLNILLLKTERSNIKDKKNDLQITTARNKTPANRIKINRNRD